jgi:hypothetical protein
MKPYASALSAACLSIACAGANAADARDQFY